MHLLRVGAIENIDRLIRKHGHNPHDVLADGGLSSALLREPETLVSYKKLADFLDYCGDICNDTLFGLHLSEIQSPLVLGELGSLLTQQRTIQEAIEFARQYMFLHARGIQFEFVANQDRIEIQFSFEFTSHTKLKHLTQMTAGHQFKYASSLAPNRSGAIKMHLRQSPEVQSNTSNTGYKDHLVFNSHFDGISIPITWLNLQMERNNEALDLYFKNRISALNERYPNDLPAQVHYLCSNLLSTGESTIDAVASALDLHPRALQRQLKKYGISFRNILQNVRRSRAEQYLQNSQLSVTDIALNLGYAETAIFCRNFKTWTGLTPMKWREENRYSSNK